MASALPADHTADYILGESLRREPGFEVFDAKEAGTLSPCFVHRINYSASIHKTALQQALVSLRRYGHLHHPRTPRIVDAWKTDHHLCVVEYKVPTRLFNASNNNPFQSGSHHKPNEVIEATLSLVSAMHLAEVVHGSVRPEVFGIGPLGKFYLADTGLDETVSEMIASAGGDFRLSQNMLARDVAAWAYWMMSLMLGEPVLRNPPEDNWDEYNFKEADNRARRVLRKPEGHAFFMDCLHGYGLASPKFDTATDALRAWHKQRLWSAFV